MDIYQIWITYNKKWSNMRLAFGILLLLTVIVVRMRM